MTKKNANAALVYSFLYKIVQVRLFPGTLVQVFNFCLLLVLKPVINPHSLIELLSTDYLQFKLWVLQPEDSMNVHFPYQYTMQKTISISYTYYNTTCVLNCVCLFVSAGI